MSIQQNKNLIRHYYNEKNQGNDPQAIVECSHQDMVAHSLAGDMDLEQYCKSAATLRSAYPYMVLVVEDMLAEADKVMVRYTLGDTQLNSHLSTPPVKKYLTSSGVNIYRIAGGKIIEQWNIADTLSYALHLGVVPAIYTRR